MSKISKFMENELDRVNEYLSMAKANLLLTTDICEDRCKKITNRLSENDEIIVNYLNEELEKLEEKIDEAKNVISKFKDFYYDLEN